MLVDDSTVVVGEAEPVWEVVVGPIVLTAEVVDATPFVDFFTLVSSEVVLVLEALFGALVPDVDVAALVVFTVVVVAGTVLSKLFEDIL